MITRTRRLHKLVVRTLNDVTYGLYLICSRSGGKLNGLIANTVVQVTSRPEKISVCISNENLTHEMILESKAFSITLLERDTPMKFIGLWGFKSGRDLDKFEGVNYKIGKTGSPIVLDHSIGYMDVEMDQRLDVGTHTIFVGRIVDSERVREGEPLTYHYYKTVKGGKASKNAPTFDNWNLLNKLEGDKERSDKLKIKYRCKKCGYVYDPSIGDDGSGISPGVTFDEIPLDWTCPLCGAGREFFVKITRE